MIDNVDYSDDDYSHNDEAADFDAAGDDDGVDGDDDADAGEDGGDDDMEAMMLKIAMETVSPLRCRISVLSGLMLHVIYATCCDANYILFIWVGITTRYYPLGFLVYLQT